MTITATIEELQPILHALGFDGVALAPLMGGSSAVFRIDCADGTRLVLKTYADDRPWGPQKEAYATGLLRDFDLPVTRYLMLDESKTRLPFRFAITNYLAGDAAQELRGEPDIEDVYRQMGALLKRLHGVRMDAYGYIGATGIVRPKARNADYVRAMFAEQFRNFRDVGGDAGLARRLERAVDERFAAVIPSTGPVFGHDDVHPGNVLAARGPDGALKITGLIDFGNARAVDALSDLAKSIFLSAHRDPRCAAAIQGGYGAIDHPDADGALWLYTLLHRVMMWWWLRRIGDIAADAPNALLDDLDAMAGQA